MQMQPKKGKAPVGGTTEASSEVTQNANQGFNMSDSTQVATSRAITVPFHGADLYVVEHGGQPFTPMKPIVEGMGIDWKNQHVKLATNQARWGMVEITIPTAGGLQSMACIALRKLFGWLAGIHVGKIKEDARAKVLSYQNECDDVLWQYWNDGIAINPRALYSVNPGDVLTKAEADALRQTIEGIAKKLSADTKVQGKFIMQAWSKLKSHFKVAYREIPRHELTEAISIISRHTLEWEVVDGAPYQPIDPLNGPALVAAREVAEDYFESYRQAVQSGQPTPHMGEIPQEVLQGMVARALFGQRMLSWFDWSKGTMGCKLIPADSSVFSLSSGNYTDLLEQVPMERLPELADALNQRMASHIGAFQRCLSNRKPAGFGRKAA